MIEDIGKYHLKNKEEIQSIIGLIYRNRKSRKHIKMYYQKRKLGQNYLLKAH
jgi:hypothetical protein